MPHALRQDGVGLRSLRLAVGYHAPAVPLYHKDLQGPPFELPYSCPSKSGTHADCHIWGVALGIRFTGSVVFSDNLKAQKPSKTCLSGYGAVRNSTNMVLSRNRIIALGCGNHPHIAIPILIQNCWNQHVAAAPGCGRPHGFAAHRLRQTPHDAKGVHHLAVAAIFNIQ